MFVLLQDCDLPHLNQFGGHSFYQVFNCAIFCIGSGRYDSWPE